MVSRNGLSVSSKRKFISTNTYQKIYIHTPALTSELNEIDLLGSWLIRVE
jgi:hypothetical protein